VNAPEFRHNLRALLGKAWQDTVTALASDYTSSDQIMRVRQGEAIGLQRALELVDEAYKQTTGEKPA
jgi:hypothetical protein